MSSTVKISEAPWSQILSISMNGSVAGKFHLEIAWIGAGNVTSMQGKSPRVLVQCAAIHVTNHLQNRMDFMLFPT